MKKQWQLQALAIEMQKDLAKCTNEFEIQNCRAICTKEIRETAEEIIKTRKLGPGEIALLSDLGINLSHRQWSEDEWKEWCFN